MAGTYGCKGFDNHSIEDYDLSTALYRAGGFSSSFGLGAKAMRRKSYGFFNALTILVGGIWEAERLAGPKPGLLTRISSIAQVLADLFDGFKPLFRSLI